MSHPAYFRIMGMGEAVVPLLLEALRQKPAHWFAALRATTNVDPVPHGTNPAAPREAWLRWEPAGASWIGRRKWTLKSTKTFPDSPATITKRTSPRDFNYNCLAFAVGDLNNWWEPPSQFGNYWPPGFPEDVTVEPP